MSTSDIILLRDLLYKLERTLEMQYLVEVPRGAADAAERHVRQSLESAIGEIDRVTATAHAFVGNSGYNALAVVGDGDALSAVWVVV